MLAGARTAVPPYTTACATDQLDWYTSVVGETPCRTYERLRQTCDSRYTIGMFNLTTPLPTTTSGDRCDSQLPECCCNVVAWNLSMLCLNCQLAGNLTAQPNGIDAGHGVYELYLDGCSNPYNASLPPHIQTDLCSEQLDLRPTLYTPMWMDVGRWYYTYFRETMQTSLQAETGKNLTHCAGISPVGPIASPQDHTLPGGAVAGAVAGGILAILGFLLLLLFWMRRRRQRAQKSHAEEGTTHAEPPGIIAIAGAPVVAASVPPSYANAFVDLPVSTDGTAYSSRGSNFSTTRGVDTFADPEESGGLVAIRLREGVAMVPQVIDSQNLRRVREKESGWRLSEKIPSLEAK